MKSFGLTALVLLAALPLATVGCCKKEKEQIEALQVQYNDLANQNQDLRTQLSQAKTREGELLSQLDAKGLQLSAKDADIDRLEALSKSQPIAPRTAGGQWDIGKYADRISVGSDILFASGRASLTSSGTDALDKIVADLKNKYPGLPVRVYGYTDSDPIKRTKKLWQDNLDLSANRSMAVTRYLNKQGIKADTIETIAMGATHFVASNTSKANKAKNRRVEIVVIKR